MERERSNSLGISEEFAKRKKESSEGRGKERGGEEWFKRSNKTQKTPEGVGKVKESGVEEMMRRWREEMGEMMKRLKGVMG